MLYLGLKKKNGKSKIDMKKCRGCSRCAEICLKDAIRVEMDDNAVNRSIERVKPLVDVESE